MAKKKIAKNQQVNIKNKRASFDYEFIDTFTAGIVLTGTEIKSIRAGKAERIAAVGRQSREIALKRRVRQRGIQQSVAVVQSYIYSDGLRHAGKRVGDAYAITPRPILRCLDVGDGDRLHLAAGRKQQDGNHSARHLHIAPPFSLQGLSRGTRRRAQWHSELLHSGAYSSAFAP